MMRRADLYLQFERSLRWNGLNNMRLVSATTKPPEKRVRNSVLVKTNFTIDDKAFDPAAIPAMNISVPTELLQPPVDEVDIEVEDANE